MPRAKNLREYSSWDSMIRRCCNPDNRMYPAYGGRGITVCDRWLDFDNFVKDMGNRPDGTTLDRIDNAGNYEPENCRWATYLQQNRNRDYAVMVTHNNETHCLSEWAEQLGINYKTIRARSAAGMPPEKLLHVGNLPTR